MNRIKRILTFNDSSEEKTKKFRNGQFVQSITSIEDLFNELFYEIFDYLNGHDIFQAFSTLNYRFQKLLDHSSYLFKIKFNGSTSEIIYMNNYKQILLQYKHKIISIHWYWTINNDEIISSLNIDSSYIHLQSLVLCSIETRRFRQLLAKLKFLPRLSSLTIKPSNEFEDFKNTYQCIFQLSNLKYMRPTASNFLLPNINNFLPIATSNQFSPIEYLVINHHCTFDELIVIISYTPKLYHLYILEIINTDLTIKISSSLANLNSICMDLCEITFNRLETFIKNLPLTLKVLSFSTQSQDINFLDAHRRKQLILQRFPQLEKFYFKYNDRRNNDNQYKIYSGQINQFYSSFWTERQWIFEVQINEEEIKYLVHPYRKTWYDYFQDNYIEYWTYPTLILTNFFTFTYDKMIFDEIKRVLSIKQIFHLSIIEKQISTHILIKLVILLSDLITLKLHSLLLDKFTEEERRIISKMKFQSKITNVYLEQINNIKECNRISLLCPRMIHFEVKYINYMDIDLFLRTIFIEINHNDNYYLRSLCFHSPLADDQMVEKLDKMIHLEKLLCDYTIKRLCENIYLQWK